MDPVCRNRDQRGIALILVLIFSILIYVLVAELVVSGRMLRHTGENDALMSRMQNQMEYTMAEVTETLLGDLASAAAGASGAAAPGGVPAMGGGAGGAGAAPAEEEQDPAATCDSSRDSWAQPQSRAENDLTTYFWIEPENKKLNLLSLFSPDLKYAAMARDQIIRLIDSLRENSEFDITASDAEQIVRAIEEWVKRPGSDSIPKPPQKSEDPKERELSLLTHLDELLMLPQVSEELFFDKVLDAKVYPGLESVLTVWTSLQMDPGDPEQLARTAAKQGVAPTAPAKAGGAASGGAANAGGATDPTAPLPQPIGEGIRININFATRPVLRALYPQGKISDEVIDAIIKWRNEEDPEAKDAAESKATKASDFGDLQLGEETPRKFFATVGDLEKVEAFANLPDPELKSEFQTLCTTKSDIFSVHLATIFRRNEETRSFVMRRARAVLMRRDEGDTGTIYPIIRFEERNGLRLVVPDLQSEHPDLLPLYSAMDSFAQDDRAWNPFLVDFYLPKQMRNEFLRR
jgi:hypothetical protein